MTNEKQREWDEKQFWFIVEDYDARTTRMDVVMMDSEPDEREKSEGSWIHAINYSAFEQQAARVKELEAENEHLSKMTHFLQTRCSHNEDIEIPSLQLKLSSANKMLDVMVESMRKPTWFVGDDKIPISPRDHVLAQYEAWKKEQG